MSGALGDTIDKLKEYIEIKTEQVKLKVLAQVAKVASNAIALATILVFSFFLVFFLSFGIAHLLNEVLESTFWGFLIIAGFYLLLVIVILLLMQKGVIQKWLEGVIVNTSESDDEENG